MYGVTCHSQQGSTLLIFLLLLVVGSSYSLVRKANNQLSHRDTITTSALTQAKQALIGYAVTYPDKVNAAHGPGYLPCPDRDNNGTTDIGACSAKGKTTIGRFPWATLELPELRDGNGQRLWYVLSDNFRNNPKLKPLNSEVPGQLTVDHRDDIVAIIIAPGAPVQGQNRDPNQKNILLEIENYLEADNHDFDTNFVSTASGESGEFNDELLFISRHELMKHVEQRVLGEVKHILSSYKNDHGVYFWLSQFVNPRGEDRISGNSNAGSSGNVLADTDKDFLNLDVAVGDLVINVTDGSRGRVASVDNATQITLDQLNFGADNTFEVGDSYIIPRFLRSNGVRHGLLPFHTSGQAFKTGFNLSWNTPVAGGAVITIDNSVTSSTHSDMLTNIIQISNDDFNFSADYASCDWHDVDTVNCKASKTETPFILSTVTNRGTVNNGMQQSVLIDTTKDFIKLGVKIGDSVWAYNATTILINDTAESGSSGTTLVDQSLGKSYIQMGVRPHEFIITNTTDNTRGIVKTVTANKITVVALPGNTMAFDDGDGYSIHQARRGIINQTPTTTSLNILSMDDSSIQFNKNDSYRLLVTTDHYQGIAAQETNITQRIVHTSLSESADIVPGNVVTNVSFGGYGVITATGINNNKFWFTYTRLKDGIYFDISQGESYRIYHSPIAQRHYYFEPQFVGSHSHVPDIAISGRQRSVCIGYSSDCKTQTAAGQLTKNITDPTILIKDYDINNRLLGSASLVLPDNAWGSIRLTNMDYYPDNIADWFIKNDWHHLTYIAYTIDHAPGTNTSCNVGVDCLTLEGIATPNNNKRALALVAGMEINKSLDTNCNKITTIKQNRNTGDISDYFEAENCDPSDSEYSDLIITNLFNDQVRIIE